MSVESVPIVIIGGGQAGLASGWCLRRAGLEPGRDFLIVDAAERSGGAWARMWPGLRLISPARYSSLPGPAMPDLDDGHALAAADVVDYLTAYEDRVGIEVRRGVRVVGVDRTAEEIRLDTTAGSLHTQRVINATGSWGRPFVPTWAGLDRFVGRQLHTAQYRGPEAFADQRVAVIGGGNSAAQILAEIAPVAAATRWITRRAPRFMPADVDGEVLFELTGARRQAGGAQACGERLGDIVVTAAVERARRERHLVAHQPFTRFDGADLVWSGPGERWRADVVLWCTGFRDDLRHLSGSGLRGAGAQVSVQDGVSTIDPRFGFVGHGDWTGPFSNTIIGVGGYARVTTGLMGVEQMGAGRRDL